MEQWYEELFKNYAKRYDAEQFVQGTIGECDFLEEEFRHNKSLEILKFVAKVIVHSRRKIEVWYRLPNPERFENWNVWLPELSNRQNFSISV